jgi:hypothetical protein
MNNQDIISAFLNGKAATKGGHAARTGVFFPSGSLSTDGVFLHSFNRRIAKWMFEKIVIYTDSVSPTTSKHISLLRSSLIRNKIPFKEQTNESRSSHN